MATTEKKVEPQKSCFIITPIGEEGSPTRIDAEGLLHAVICPVLNELGYERECISIPHRMSKPGSITNQVIERLLADTLVVANLTGLTPNVMYELAVRHAVGKPVIVLAEQTTKLPFDLYSERALLYTNHLGEVDNIKTRFRAAIKEAEKETTPDNPVYRVTKGKIIREAPETTNAERHILERLDKIDEKLQNGKMADAFDFRGKPCSSPYAFVLDGKKENVLRALRWLQSLGARPEVCSTGQTDKGTYCAEVRIADDSPWGLLQQLAKYYKVTVRNPTE